MKKYINLINELHQRGMHREASEINSLLTKSAGKSILQKMRYILDAIDIKLNEQPADDIRVEVGKPFFEKVQPWQVEVGKPIMNDKAQKPLTIEVGKPIMNKDE